MRVFNKNLPIAALVQYAHTPYRGSNHVTCNNNNKVEACVKYLCANKKLEPYEFVSDFNGKS